MSCGHQSADGEKVCGNCGAPLRQVRESAASVSVPYCRAPLLDLESWVKGFELGELSPEEFRRRLEARLEKYRLRVEEVKAYELPADVRDTMSEEYSCGRRGIEGLYEAVKMLLEYAKHADSGMRDAALAQAEASLNLLHRAMCLNAEASQVLEKSLEDMVNSAQGDKHAVGGFDTGGFMMGEMNIAGF